MILIEIRDYYSKNWALIPDSLDLTLIELFKNWAQNAGNYKSNLFTTRGTWLKVIVCKKQAVYIWK